MSPAADDPTPEYDAGTRALPAKPSTRAANSRANGRPRDRKEQLTAVAAELFHTRGYHDVALSDIAAAAGVTGPAIYRHFNDKRDILAQAVLGGLSDFVHASDGALADGALADGTTGAHLDSLLGALARLAVERRHVAALWRTQRRHLRESDREEVRRQSARLLGSWARALRSVRPELAEADAELLCWAALSVFGSVSMHATRVTKRRFEALLLDCARAVLHARLPRPEGPAQVNGQSRRPVLRASRREQLIDEAGRLFRERGFHEVSMEDIGAAAGISGPSVYRHFPSKARVFMAAAQRIADELARGRLEVSRRAHDEAAALRGLASSYVRTMLAHADLIAAGQQMSALSADERAELRRVQREYVGEWVRLLCRARSELTGREGRIVVHVALTIANDLVRTPRVRARAGIDAELVTLMTAALGLPGNLAAGEPGSASASA